MMYGVLGLPTGWVWTRQFIPVLGLAGLLRILFQSYREDRFRAECSNPRLLKLARRSE
jgi:hypothetical protein